MTLQEVAQEIGRSEKTIYKNFKRTQAALLKRGIILTRWGPDEYEVEYEEKEMSYLEEKQRKNKIDYLKRKLQELEEEQGE